MDGKVERNWDVFCFEAYSDTVREDSDCVFFANFFPLGRGEWIWGTSKSSLPAFSCTRDESCERCWRAYSFFKPFSIIMLDRFLVDNLRTWCFLPNQGVDARLVELQHLDGQGGTNLDRKVGCVEDGSTWWPIGMFETWRWSPGRIRSIRVRPQQIQVAATFLILDPPKTPMPSWVTFNFVSIHRSPPDFFAARKPERQVQHAKAEDSTEVSRSSVHIPGARRGIFVTWGVGIRLVDIPDFHSRQDSTPPAKRSCRNHWFQHAHWNPRPFFWSWKIAGVFVQFTHGYVVLYWEDYTISRCIRGFS